MTKFYQIQLNQLKRIEKRLDILESDLDTILLQINAANDLVKQKQLERQQNQILEEMRKVSQQYDQLKRELEKLPEHQEFQERQESLSKLINLLDSISVDKLFKSYQVCLPEARIFRKDETKETLLQRLAEMPEGETEIKPILRVIKRLSQDNSLTPKQQKDLQTWLQTQGLPPETLVNEQQQIQLAQPETCLMVKVRLRTLNDLSKGYLISAVLVIDPNPCEQEDKRTAHTLKIPPPTDSKLFPAYSQDELEKVVAQLIESCGSSKGNHPKIALSDLIVQLFLPTELLNLPIEHWRFSQGRHCCGHRCKSVLIRSSDRHFSDFYDSANGDWEKYWKRFLSISNTECIKALPMLNYEQKTKVESYKSQVIGCRFIEHCKLEEQQRFWEDILDQGLPIALGIRHLEIIQLEMTTEQAIKKARQSMNKVIKDCPIANLPESLMKKRQQILSKKYKSEIEQLQEARLCLLWDNPFRPFPNIEYQSE